MKIYHRHDKTQVLWTDNTESTSLSHADLSAANLSAANLYGANLSHAKIRENLTLVGDRPIIQVSNIGSRQDTLSVWLTDKGLMIQTGCFFGTESEFLEKLERTHGTNEYAVMYRAALLLINAHRAIYLPKKYQP